MTSEFEKIKQSAEQVSSKFAEVSKRSLRALHQTKRWGFRPTIIFCKSPYACEDKYNRKVRGSHDKNRIYQTCTFKEKCNQQSYDPVWWEV